MSRGFLALLCVCLVAPGLAFAQSLYKYRGPDGEWVYTDRNPGAGHELEVRALSRGSESAEVTVRHEETEAGLVLIAQNEFYAPVQVVLGFDELEGFYPPDASQSLRFVVAARAETRLLELAYFPGSEQSRLRYRYEYLLGDPGAEHRPRVAYRAPFAVAATHTVSQAYPLAITHTTPGSRHAVDIAMPIGTDVHAARGGVVIAAASTNFRSGIDPNEEGAQANLVQILHDDGTFAIYAHLNWNSIRVRPGDRVVRGEYIADSGNTGFSTGPHLHFAVLRNADLRSESLPVTFEGPNGSVIVPKAGITLTAY